MPAEALWAKADGITFGNVPRWRASQCVRFITTIGWGLLRPARTATGYRVYGASDFQRLEQIVALEFLGLPLKDIKMLLDRDSRELADVLAAQRSALVPGTAETTSATATTLEIDALLTMLPPL